MARATKPATGPPQQTANALMRRLDALGEPEHAVNLRWYFKTGPGEYGEGDVFIGVRMPAIRKLCGEFRELPLAEAERVLMSAVHEHRLAALVILSDCAKRLARGGETAPRRELCDFYLAHTARINNWDLVDVSCRDVVGEYLLSIGDARPLKKLARSKSLWDRRIAMVSTSAFIRAGEIAPVYEVAALLLADTQDLIHKAVGWMLREAGKRDEAALEEFLSQHAHTMPRTTLCYAIERMGPQRRKQWLAHPG